MKIINIVLFILIFELYRKSHRKNIDLKLALIGLIFIASGNTILSNSDSYINGEWGIILANVGFFFIFFHYQSIAHLRPKILLLSVISVLFCSQILLFILIVLYIDSNGIILYQEYFTFYQNLPEFIQNILFLLKIINNLFVLCILLDALIIIAKVHKKTQIQATKTELIALIILVISRAIFLIYDVWFSGNLYLELAILIFSLIGIIILLSNYLQNPDYIYLLPIPIHSFMVYNKAGVMCYLRKVEHFDEDLEKKAFLMSGIFSAISSLIQETLGTQAKIHHIDAQRFQIFFEPLPNDQGLFVTIAYGRTAYFQKSLTRFIKTIEDSLLSEINVDLVDLAPIRPKFESLIKNCYPYTFEINE